IARVVSGLAGYSIRLSRLFILACHWCPRGVPSEPARAQTVVSRRRSRKQRAPSRFCNVCFTSTPDIARRSSVGRFQAEAEIKLRQCPSQTRLTPSPGGAYKRPSERLGFKPGLFGFE